MQGTFLLELWKALSPTEHRALLKFLDSPAHNLRPDVKALAGLLAATPSSGWAVLDKQHAFSAVFPGQPYDHLRFNHTCSFLVQRIESFLAWQEMEQDEKWRHWMLCRSLRKRGANEHFLRRSGAALQALEQQPLRNAEHHLVSFLLESERIQHRVLHERESPTGLSRVTEPLDRFFTLENLRWAGTALSLQARYGAHNLLAFSTPVLQNAAQADAAQAPEIVLMRLAYETMQDTENEENFRQLKALIADKSHLFSSAENRDLYLLAINFCLRRHNRGERPAYTREAFALYREALERGLLFEHGLLPKFTFNNILRLACIGGERDWARAFLDLYREHLPAEDRENTYRFNLASWHYLGGDYAQVPGLLQTFDFADRDTQLSARQMLLRSYFETQEWFALDSLLKSFYSFLRRRHDIGYQRLMYLNLIKFTRKLMSGPLNKRKTASLRERIQAEPYVAERDWLLSKLSPSPATPAREKK
ncbi:MAG TPA: hypothetical protein PK971_01570 [Saprospiraceae bacterium]|nr:hypothetical protein [Saprospiraceae bacterium]